MRQANYQETPDLFNKYSKSTQLNQVELMLELLEYFIEPSLSSKISGS